ncbi:hypothetical protein F0Q45_21820 [Mycobacterium simiae]|uniref:Uncharacterized protein n=1 Tax=Mycobacterium simiae TaxID=1784 RepID=A0A5B1BK11_MYCSI|nr:hypothetical protein [Mycobacterium simiae]KAA1248215.1 hypothetical protein F0Q45_21820 [Mycobacterium simiae]
MTLPAALTVPTAWVPDYLHGSLRRWQSPQTCRCRRYDGDQVIHCVGRVQHFLDIAFGRPPRSRCGVLLIQRSPTALFEEGAPLCPACAAITHPPAAQIAAFNHRGDDHATPR